jgi:hypothetical protein
MGQQCSKNVVLTLKLKGRNKHELPQHGGQESWNIAQLGYNQQLSLQPGCRETWKMTEAVMMMRVRT